MRKMRYNPVSIVSYVFIAAFVLLVLCNDTKSQGTLPSREEMWEIIQKQQQEIEQLKKSLNVVEEEVETTGEMLEQVAEQPLGGGPSWADKTSLGGYGELHYNNLDNQLKGGDDRDQIDFHRFVLYIGHEFNDRIRFFSEVELEHALTFDSNDGDGDEAPGEVELEQAYVDIDINAEQTHTFRAGLFLVPVGILNETHEPPTFYGVERNNVESRIIPSTWWEGGLGVVGEIAPGLNYDVAFTSGLAVGDSYSIRGGRQKVAEAKAEDGAFTGRLKWTRPGIELASTFQFQTDITQERSEGAPEESQATLFEIHGVFEQGPFAFRGLYARWDLDADAAEDIGADEQYGWFIEPSLKLFDYFGVFLRYSQWDNSAGNSDSTDTKELDVGVNWWPHENVVFKFDYQNQDAPAKSSEFDGINLGVGYQF